MSNKRQRLEGSLLCARSSLKLGSWLKVIPTVKSLLSVNPPGTQPCPDMCFLNLFQVQAVEKTVTGSVRLVLLTRVIITVQERFLGMG